MREALALVLAYLLGSVPFAYLAGRSRGVDLRTMGSGNLGASNVFRTLGRGIGVAVMVLDIAKGAVAVLIAQALTSYPWPLVAAGAVVAGHVFPVWLRFRGGKGVATAAGAVIALMPLVSVVLFAIWIALVLVTRYTSLASMAGAVAFPVLVIAFHRRWPYLLLGSIIAAAVLVLHRENAMRLWQGRENRINLRARPSSRQARPGGAKP